MRVLPTRCILGASDPDSNENITSWTINWGDGSVQSVSGNPSSVTHTYAMGPAQETISATATDQVGTYNSNSINVNVLNVPPIRHGGRRKR